MDWNDYVIRSTGGRGPSNSGEEQYLRRDWEMRYGYNSSSSDRVRSRSNYESVYENMTRYGYGYSSDPAMTTEPKDENLEKYRARKLKEYSEPKFRTNGNDLLPNEMVPCAVMLPKADVKARVKAYLEVA